MAKQFLGQSQNPAGDYQVGKEKDKKGEIMCTKEGVS